MLIIRPLFEFFKEIIFPTLFNVKVRVGATVPIPSDENNTKKFFLDYYSKESDVLKSFASDTVTKWIEHSMLPDDITIMNIRF